MWLKPYTILNHFHSPPILKLHFYEFLLLLSSNSFLIIQVVTFSTYFPIKIVKISCFPISLTCPIHHDNLYISQLTHHWMSCLNHTAQQAISLFIKKANNNNSPLKFHYKDCCPLPSCSWCFNCSTIHSHSSSMSCMSHTAQQVISLL